MKNGCGILIVFQQSYTHMTDIKDNFVSLDEKLKSKVKFADGNSVNVEGKGIIAVQTKRGTPKLMTYFMFLCYLKLS